MINKIKSFVRKHRFLRRILYVFHFKLFFYNLLYRHKAIRNIPFKYQLPDGDFISLYPQGQIAKSLFIGGFECEEIKLFFSFLKPGMHIIDVGANIGIYSIVAEKKLRGDGKIWSFEPAKNTYKMFIRNLAINKAKNVIMYNVGLGDGTSKKAVLRQDIGYGDGEKYIIPNNTAPDYNLPNVNQIMEKEEISLVTIDAIIQRAGNPKIDFIKIDTEGFEYFILLGAENVIKSNPNIIILMECTRLGNTRAGVTQDSVFSLIREKYGLNIFYWDSAQGTWSNNTKSAKKAGNVWVCKDIDQLPIL
ncbi:MAG: FkbM family methyltransferase [Actinobacteria bacterium]|nr:FkbM family methyltransferase [Actinomycetota bacterium]